LASARAAQLNAESTAQTPLEVICLMEAVQLPLGFLTGQVKQFINFAAKTGLCLIAGR